MSLAVRFFQFTLPIGLICSCQSPGSEKSSSSGFRSIEEYISKGREISGLAQAELLKNVSRAMDSGGPVFAVDFCNLHASFLMDSLSEHLECRISRTSLKARNALNAPSGSKEKILLNEMLEATLEGKPLRDTLLSDDKEVIYYKPIQIGTEVCLKCHGLPQKDISNETLTMLYERYPGDKARGYRMGDFRGAWRIIFTE